MAVLDFLKAGKVRRAITLSVGTRTVETFELLAAIEYRLLKEEGRTPVSKWAVVKRVLELAGFSSKLLTLNDIVTVSEAIDEVNPPVPTFAWQTKSQDPKADAEEIVLEDNTNYKNQHVAAMVAKLGKVFGWSPQDVYGLTYYEVLAFMQEALLIEHEEREWQYYMSADIGVEKKGQSYVKKPYDPPSWLKKTAKRVRAPGSVLPEKFQPGGVVVDLSQYRTDKTNGQANNRG